MATKGFGQYALPLSGAPGPRTAGGGGSPRAIIMHNTAGHGNAKGVTDYWKSERPGVGTQYIVERDGTIRDTKDFGHKGTAHIHEGKVPKGVDISNKNTVGFEIVSKTDSDVTPAQIEAVRNFVEKNYPGVPVKGHEQVNPGHREKDEGMRAVDAVNEGRDSLAKVADVTKAGGQYALPARETMIAELAKEPAPQQYALPKMAEDPMTADAGAPARPGYNYPSKVTPETKAAIENVAHRYGLSPDAIAGVIDTESKWNPQAETGKYRGLTQMGPEQKSYANLFNMTPAQQVGAYGDWLQHYNFADKAQAAGVDLSTMTPAQQAAYLQGFQFAPNAIGWQSAYGQGKDTLPTTATKQAEALGDKSMKSMTAYYDKMMGGGQKATTQVAKVPDIGKAFETAAAGAGGDTAPKIDAPKGGKATAESGFKQAAKAFAPDASPPSQYALPKSAPKADSALQVAGSIANVVGDAVRSRPDVFKDLGAGGDAAMEAKIASIKNMPSPPTTSLAEPPPAKAEPVPKAEPLAKMAEGPKADPFAIAEPFGPLSTQQAATKPPDMTLPPPPVIPKGVETAQVDPFAVTAATFGTQPQAPSTVPEVNYASLFGETPNMSGGSVGKDLLAALNQRANENMVRDTAQDAPKIEEAPATPAQGSGGGGAGGRGAEVAGALTDGTERFGEGVLVPPVHTPLDFSAIQASINAPVNPLAGVNMQSPAFWFNNNPLG